ncbi:hypothetical protein AVT10_07125 [Sphingomonas hankookensis]|jgi:RimJ/RimL family protein N-acetyltransferase|uniref:N-acetyltransferase domain-containing protein n=2 Tax=Sphingomonadaceae TaxID=41297 RepID=A0ABR5Y8H7_9SPHN|nr:hypothetical protein AVT10_07125 [Sphingomonas hankookensis]PZT95641.1 MAG: N-acetyltransferase [Sphingomonas sp.]RSV18686.1 N-acetyltransferase [Sphingomonas sp. ABOLH]
MSAMTRPFDRPVLHAPPLILRRPEPRDSDAIVRICGDAEIARRLARVPHPYGATDAAFFLDHVVPHEWVWAITLDGDDTLIGVVGLTPGDDPASAELGYWLAREHWGRGIMPRSAGAVVGYGFDTLGLSTITSGYFEANPASGRVLAKLGFVETGRQMGDCLATGAPVSTVRLVLQPAGFA